MKLRQKEDPFEVLDAELEQRKVEDGWLQEARGGTWIDEVDEAIQGDFFEVDGD